MNALPTQMGSRFQILFCLKILPKLADCMFGWEPRVSHSHSGGKILKHFNLEPIPSRCYSIACAKLSVHRGGVSTASKSAGSIIGRHVCCTAVIGHTSAVRHKHHHRPMQLMGHSHRLPQEGLQNNCQNGTVRRVSKLRKTDEGSQLPAVWRNPWDGRTSHTAHRIGKAFKKKPVFFSVRGSQKRRLCIVAGLPASHNASAARRALLELHSPGMCCRHVVSLRSKKKNSLTESTTQPDNRIGIAPRLGSEGQRYREEVARRASMRAWDVGSDVRCGRKGKKWSNALVRARNGGTKPPEIRQG